MVYVDKISRVIIGVIIILCNLRWVLSSFLSAFRLCLIIAQQSIQLHRKAILAINQFLIFKSKSQKKKALNLQNNIRRIIYLRLHPEHIFVR